jgi:hypothetical protein
MRRLLAAALPALFLPLAWVQERIDGRLGAFRSQEEVLYLWSGQQVKRLFPGFESLAADIYWLRTVQYFGGQRLFSRDKRFELLPVLADITTTLDPRLEIAYRYGAIFLCEPRPVGAGNPEQGISLLEKGVRALPLDWRLRQQLGFFHFIFLHDGKRASEVLMEASRLPGAAFWLKSLAAEIVGKQGDRAAARRMWWQMYEESEIGVLKANAADRLQVLDALDAADALTARVAEYRRRFGANPATLDQLPRAGLFTDSLVDPSGTPFAYDPASGAVSVSRGSPLWRPD